MYIAYVTIPQFINKSAWNLFTEDGDGEGGGLDVTITYFCEVLVVFTPGPVRGVPPTIIVLPAWLTAAQKVQNFYTPLLLTHN